MFIAVLGDEETITGFTFAGLENFKDNPVFHVVDVDTHEDEVLNIYRDVLTREDIAIFFISDFAYRKIEKLMEVVKDSLPLIMEIPSRKACG